MHADSSKRMKDCTVPSPEGDTNGTLLSPLSLSTRIFIMKRAERMEEPGMVNDINETLVPGAAGRRTYELMGIVNILHPEKNPAQSWERWTGNPTTI